MVVRSGRALRKCKIVVRDLIGPEVRAQLTSDTRSLSGPRFRRVFPTRPAGLGTICLPDYPPHDLTVSQFTRTMSPTEWRCRCRI